MVTVLIRCRKYKCRLVISDGKKCTLGRPNESSTSRGVIVAPPRFAKSGIAALEFYIKKHGQKRLAHLTMIMALDMLAWFSELDNHGRCLAKGFVSPCHANNQPCHLTCKTLDNRPTAPGGISYVEPSNPFILSALTLRWRKEAFRLFQGFHLHSHPLAGRVTVTWMGHPGQNLLP